MAERKIEDLIGPTPGELVIVIGPMTAGKTTLIHKLLGEGRIHEDQVVGGTQESSLLEKNANNGVIYHFNSYVALADARQGMATIQGSFADLLTNFDFRAVLNWSHVRRWLGPKRSIVLMIDELTCWRRIATRIGLVPGLVARNYPSDFWLQLAQLTVLATHYRLLFKGLRDDGIEFVALDATKADYQVIDDVELHLQKVPLARNALTDDDICLFTRHSGFEKGLTEERRIKNALKRRRQSNAMKILFEDADWDALPELKGKSVLDIQCGWGGFCFEAERRGASRVVGLEAAVDRFAAACAMKRMLGSSAEFFFGDASSIQLDGTFDFVLRTDGRLQFIPWQNDQ